MSIRFTAPRGPIPGRKKRPNISMVKVRKIQEMLNAGITHRVIIAELRTSSETIMKVVNGGYDA